MYGMIPQGIPPLFMTVLPHWGFPGDSEVYSVMLQICKVVMQICKVSSR